MSHCASSIQRPNLGSTIRSNVSEQVAVEFSDVICSICELEPVGVEMIRVYLESIAYTEQELAGSPAP